MIQINLLPEGYRRRERLSFKVWGAILAAVILVSCSVGYFGHVYLSEFKKIEGDRIEREERLTLLKEFAKYDDQLVASAKEYVQREGTIQGIANSRALWTRLLDKFIDVVNNDGNTERHNVWFRNLAVGGGTAARGPTWGLAAFSQSASFTKQANFLDDVKDHTAFFGDFAEINAPGGRVVESDNRTPKEAVAFKLTMQMHPPKAWKQNQPKAKK